MNSGEFLSAKLMTPRTEIAAQSPLIYREPLLVSQALSTAVASYETTPKTPDDRLTAALNIANIVHDSLSPKTVARRTTLLTPESLAESEEANCYGYSIVLSECLDKAHIDHFIGFANGHSFVIMHDESNGTYKMIDALTRKYSGDITSALRGPDILGQFEAGASRADVELHTDEMLRQRGLSAKKIELSEINRWISHENPYAQSLDAGISRAIRDHILRLRVFQATDGRSVLLHYTNAVVYVNNNDSDAAADELVLLDGMYPDMDSRNEYIVATMARSLAIRNGEWGNAALVADIIDNSIGPRDSLHARYFKPDTLRKIGNSTGIAELFEHAIAAYEAIPSMRIIHRQKIEAAKKQYDALVQKADIAKA